MGMVLQGENILWIFKDLHAFWCSVLIFIQTAHFNSEEILVMAATSGFMESNLYKVRLDIESRYFVIHLKYRIEGQTPLQRYMIQFATPDSYGINWL
jgi:hypothetical protein